MYQRELPDPRRDPGMSARLSVANPADITASSPLRIRRNASGVRGDLRRLGPTLSGLLLRSREYDMVNGEAPSALCASCRALPHPSARSTPHWGALSSFEE